MKTKIILSIIMMAGFLTLAVAGLVGEITETSDISEKFSLDVETITKLDSKNIDDALKQDYVKEGEDAFIYLYQENGINDFIKIDSYYMNCSKYLVKEREICTEGPYNYTYEVCEEEIKLDEKTLEEVYSIKCHNETEVRYNTTCITEQYVSDECSEYKKVYYSDTELKNILNQKVKERLELIASVDRLGIKEVVK